MRLAAGTLGLRHRLVVDIALFAGARRAEIAGLRWADIDLDAKRMRIFGKGRKEGVVPLHKELIAELELWRLVEPAEEWVFPSRYGHGKALDRHMEASSVWKLIKEAGHKARVGVTPHRLRHTFATELLDAGANVRAVQELLRHVSLNSTQIYTGVSVGHLEEDVARLRYGGGKLEEGAL